MGEASDKAKADEQEFEKAREEMRELEEGHPPELGPADLEYQEDGSIEIEGEQVEDPDEYRGEPIPGGPTDDS